MSAETAAVLRAARALIDMPRKWSKKAIARSRSQAYVSPYSPAACSFCTVGSVRRAASILGDIASPALNALMDQLPDEWEDCIAEWNDAPERTHAEVLAAFDAAIAAEEATP